MPVYDYSSGKAEFVAVLYYEVEDVDATTPVDPFGYECPESDLYAIKMDA